MIGWKRSWPRGNAFRVVFQAKRVLPGNAFSQQQLRVMKYFYRFDFSSLVLCPKTLLLGFQKLKMSKCGVLNLKVRK